PVITGRLRPAVPGAMRRGRVPQRFLKPGVLAGGVVQHHVHEHADVTLVRGRDERLEVIVRAVIRLNLVIIRDVVPVIARRLGDRHQPHTIGAQPFYVVELLRETAQVADAVAVAVVKRPDEDLVAHCGLLPRRRLKQCEYDQGMHSKLASRPSAALGPTNTRNLPGSTTGFTSSHSNATS